eukprot:scaffold68539_cov85-Phaeocystis_antarctica.AAC.2
MHLQRLLHSGRARTSARRYILQPPPSGSDRLAQLRAQHCRAQTSRPRQQSKWGSPKPKPKPKPKPNPNPSLTLTLTPAQSNPP